MPTQAEWLTKVNKNATVLRRFVGAWHPSAREPRAIQRQSVLLTDGSAVAVDVPEASMPSTAPNAEHAYQVVRDKIRQEEPKDPLTRWDAAVANGDIDEITSLLNGAWCGVPESTSCWSIEGFSEAMDLLDDPPDDPDQEPGHQTGCICADCSGAELAADND